MWDKAHAAMLHRHETTRLLSTWETVSWHQRWTVRCLRGWRSSPREPVYVSEDKRRWGWHGVLRCEGEDGVTPLHRCWQIKREWERTRTPGELKTHRLEYQYTDRGPQSFDRDDRGSPALAGAHSSHPIKPQARIRRPLLQIRLAALPFLWHESVSSFTALTLKTTHDTHDRN